MNILRFVAIPIAFVALIIWMIVTFVESEEKDLGPLPVYESQNELDTLIEKGKSHGLTQKESARLRLLSDNRKREIDLYYEQHIKGEKLE